MVNHYSGVRREYHDTISIKNALQTENVVSTTLHATIMDWITPSTIIVSVYSMYTAIKVTIRCEEEQANSREAAIATHDRISNTRCMRAVLSIIHATDYGVNMLRQSGCWVGCTRVYSTTNLNWSMLSAIADKWANLGPPFLFVHNNLTRFLGYSKLLFFKWIISHHSIYPIETFYKRNPYRTIDAAPTLSSIHLLISSLV